MYDAPRLHSNHCFQHSDSELRLCCLFSWRGQMSSWSSTCKEPASSCTPSALQPAGTATARTSSCRCASTPLLVQIMSRTAHPILKPLSWHLSNVLCSQPCLVDKVLTHRVLMVQRKYCHDRLGLLTLTHLVSSCAAGRACEANHSQLCGRTELHPGACLIGHQPTCPWHTPHNIRTGDTCSRLVMPL